MDLSGLGSAALHVIPTNDLHQIDIDALKAAIAQDRNAGLTPFLVIGAAGTVDTGAIDDLAALAAIARQEKLWFHVDGAIGALAIMAPDIAPRLAGIQQADSIALDFHKCGQVPYDAGFILVRDGTLHRDTFASPAAYLRRETRGLAAGSQWPCDFGPDLSRGFRALKTWFTLKVYGTDALGAMISRTCELARYLEIKIATSHELELLAPVSLNIVCFRYRGDDPDRLNAKIVADLHESGIAAPSTTLIGNRLAIRAAIVNHRTEPRDIDALLKAVSEIRRRCGDKLCRLSQRSAGDFHEHKFGRRQRAISGNADRIAHAVPRWPSMASIWRRCGTSWFTASTRSRVTPPRCSIFRPSRSCKAGRRIASPCKRPP